MFEGSGGNGNQPGGQRALVVVRVVPSAHTVHTMVAMFATRSRANNKYVDNA